MRHNGNVYDQKRSTFWWQKIYLCFIIIEIMSKFNDSTYPFLNEHHEEYKILMDYVDEYQKQKSNSKRYKSGIATLNVIHKHLKERGIRLHDNPRVKISEVETKMNLLYVLKTGVNLNKPEYSVHDLDAVIKISNNAVGDSKNNTPSEPVKNIFEKFKRFNKKLRTYVVVLVENSNYKNAFKEAFVLMLRNPKTSKVAYDNLSMINNLIKEKQLKITNDWERLCILLR